MSDLMDECRQYGFIDIAPRSQGPYIRVWRNNYEPITIPTGPWPIRAMWQGNNIVAEFENSPPRVYHGLSSDAFTEIY